jgi:histidine ammonia-lyase
LAIELFAAAQAVDLSSTHKDKKLGKGTKAVYDLIRSAVPVVKDDRELYLDFNKVAALIDSGKIVEAVEKEIGGLK